MVPVPDACWLARMGLAVFLAVAIAACSSGNASMPRDGGPTAPSDKLDVHEQKRADAAVLEAVTAGAPRRWSTERPGFYGYIEPGPSVTVGDGMCREFTHTMFIDGRARKDFGRACKGGTGNWAVMPPVGA